MKKVLTIVLSIAILGVAAAIIYVVVKQYSTEDGTAQQHEFEIPDSGSTRPSPHTPPR